MADSDKVGWRKPKTAGKDRPYRRVHSRVCCPVGMAGARDGPERRPERVTFTWAIRDRREKRARERYRKTARGRWEPGNHSISREEMEMWWYSFDDGLEMATFWEVAAMVSIPLILILIGALLGIWWAL